MGCGGRCGSSLDVWLVSDGRVLGRREGGGEEVVGGWTGGEGGGKGRGRKGGELVRLGILGERGGFTRHLAICAGELVGDACSPAGIESRKCFGGDGLEEEVDGED